MARNGRWPSISAVGTGRPVVTVKNRSPQPIQEFALALIEILFPELKNVSYQFLDSKFRNLKKADRERCWAAEQVARAIEVALEQGVIEAQLEITDAHVKSWESKSSRLTRDPKVEPQSQLRQVEKKIDSMDFGEFIEFVDFDDNPHAHRLSGGMVRVDKDFWVDQLINWKGGTVVYTYQGLEIPDVKIEICQPSKAFDRFDVFVSNLSRGDLYEYCKRSVVMRAEITASGWRYIAACLPANEVPKLVDLISYMKCYAKRMGWLVEESLDIEPRKSNEDQCAEISGFTIRKYAELILSQYEQGLIDDPIMGALPRSGTRAIRPQ